MNSDLIADGEAMPSDGVDVTQMLGAGRNVVELRADPELEAFAAYRDAWRANEEHPTLHRAAALVRAWNAYADVVRLDHV